VSTKIILLFSLAFDETYAVFKISFERIPHAVGAHTGRTYCILWYFLLGILTICELLIIINKLIINEILWSEQIACPALCCFKQNIVAPINDVFLSLSEWVSFHLEGVNLGLCKFLVRANCVHCPWALQPEHSGHY
jgi:hypothetical protein